MQPVAEAPVRSDTPKIPVEKKAVLKSRKVTAFKDIKMDTSDLLSEGISCSLHTETAVFTCCQRLKGKD